MGLRNISAKRSAIKRRYRQPPRSAFLNRNHEPQFKRPGIVFDGDARCCQISRTNCRLARQGGPQARHHVRSKQWIEQLQGPLGRECQTIIRADGQRHIAQIGCTVFGRNRQDNRFAGGVKALGPRRRDGRADTGPLVPCRDTSLFSQHRRCQHQQAGADHIAKTICPVSHNQLSSEKLASTVPSAEGSSTGTTTRRVCPPPIRPKPIVCWISAPE